MKKSNALAILWNRAESVEGCYTVIHSPDDVMNIVRSNAVDGHITHYHESLMTASKIFFDIDIKLPTRALSNAAINQYCQQQLGYSDDLVTSNIYAFEYRKHFGSSLEQYLVYTAQDAILSIYCELFAADFEARGCRFAKDNKYQSLCNKLTAVDKEVHMRDLDRAFDVYRNSRSMPHDLFKASFHLVLAPTEFYMARREQQHIAISIGNLLMSRLQSLQQLISAELKMPFNFQSSLLDPSVYTGSNIRMLQQSKDDVNSACAERKCAIHMGGVFIRAQRLLLNHPKLTTQLPHRFLISLVTRSDGTELQLLTQGTSLTTERIQTYTNNTPCPISNDTLMNVLSKIGVVHAEIDSCSNNGEHMYILTIKDFQSPCPLCAPLKKPGERLCHTSNRMWVVINTMEETIHFSCFRIVSRLQAIAKNMAAADREQFIKRERYIKLDYRGDVYISDYDLSRGLFRQDDVQDIPQHDRNDIANDELASHTRALKPSTLERIINRYDREHQLPDHLQKMCITTNKDSSEVGDYPPQFKRLYVKSHMGTGKTKSLFEYMKTFIANNPTARIYIVTFRVTFAQDMMAKLNAFMQQHHPSVNFVCYTDVKNRDINKQYLVIQVESLNRIVIRQDTRCDLLILDESESIYEQLSSGLSDKEVANLANFKALVRFSSQVIAMDAYLQERTIDLTERFAHNALPSTELKDMPLLEQDRPRLISNKWQRKKRYIVYKGRYRKDLWLHDIIKSINSGERVVVPCGNAQIAKAVYEAVVNAVDRKYNVQLFTQDTNEKQRIEDLKDVQKAWTRYDALIYSPTISAGISFERKHYHRMFAYFEIGVTTLETFFQMMGRVRQIEKNCIHVLIAGIPQAQPQTLEAIERDFIVKRNNASVPPLLERVQFEYDNSMNTTIIRNDDFRVLVHNIHTRNMSTQSPVPRFYWMVGTAADVYIRKANDSFKSAVHLDSIVKQLKSEQFQAIQQEPLSEEQFANPTDVSDYAMRKIRNISALGLAYNQRHFYTNMKSESEFKAWHNKYMYFRLRMQYGSLKVSSEQNRVGATMNMHVSISKFGETEHAVSRVLEMILSSLGLNQDIINYERFKSKACKHVACNCIAQSQDVTVELTTAFADQSRNIKVLNDELKTANFGAKIELVDSATVPKSTQVFRRFKSILKTHYNLEVKLEHNHYVLRHRDRFDLFLAANPDAQTFKFKRMTHFPEMNTLPTVQKRLMWDYNYYGQDWQKAIAVIEADLNTHVQETSRRE